MVEVCSSDQSFTLYFSDLSDFTSVDLDLLKLGLNISDSTSEIPRSSSMFKDPVEKVKKKRSSRTKSDKNYSCPNCSSVYNRQDNLTQHLKYVCFQKPRFGCAYCDYVTKMSYNVYNHVRSKHPSFTVGFIDLYKSNRFVPYVQTKNDRVLRV